jgi:hypothetical protein
VGGDWPPSAEANRSSGSPIVYAPATRLGLIPDDERRIRTIWRWRASIPLSRPSRLLLGRAVLTHGELDVLGAHEARRPAGARWAVDVGDLPARFEPASPSTMRDQADMVATSIFMIEGADREGEEDAEGHARSLRNRDQLPARHRQGEL